MIHISWYQQTVQNIQDNRFMEYSDKLKYLQLAKVMLGHDNLSWINNLNPRSAHFSQRVKRKKNF